MPSQRLKLTKKSVETCQPPQSGFVVIHDADLSGFHVRVHSSGRRSYHLHYRHRGQERRPKIGEHGVITAEQARQIAVTWKGLIASGKDPAAQETVASVPTLSQLFARFQDWGKSRHKPRTAEHNAYLFRAALEPAFGSKHIDAITRAQIEHFHASLASNRTKANHALVLLRTLFNKAKHWGLLAGRDNPCDGVSKFKEGRHERFLTEAELERLHQSLDWFDSASLAPKSAIAAIRLLIHTGCRRNEVLELKWREVDLAREELVLRDSKTGRKRVVLNAPALAVLGSLSASEPDNLVIAGTRAGKPLQGLEKIWQRVRKHADLEDVRLHDLRHSYASFAISQGVSLEEVGALLGHKDIRTTQRYAHLSEGQVRAAAKKVGSLTSAKDTQLRRSQTVEQGG